MNIVPSHISQFQGTGVGGLQRSQEAAGADLPEAQTCVRRLLHRLMSATNRRMHKGYPEMLSYLTGKPMEYASHEFVPLSFGQTLTMAVYNILQATRRGGVQGSRERDAYGDSATAQPPLADSLRGEAADDNGTAEVREPTINLRSKVPRHVSVSDYLHRPLELSKFPLYYFIAGCEITTKPGDASLAWGADARAQSKVVMSKQYPELPLLHPTSHQPIRVHEYFIRLRTHESWRVPILYGAFPKGEQEASSDQERGMLALFLLTLFRPHRNDVELLGEINIHDPPEETSSEPWTSLYVEYKRWRENDIDAVAATYFDRSATEALPEPAFDSTEWWACMVSQSLRNMDMLLSRHHGAEFNVPKDISTLPETAAPQDADGYAGAEPSEPAGDEDDDCWRPHVEQWPEAECPASDVEEINKQESHKFPPPEVSRCGDLPAGTTLEGLHSTPHAARSQEAIYARGFQESMQRGTTGSRSSELAVAKLVEDELLPTDAAGAALAVAGQIEYFKAIDRYEADPSILDGGCTAKQGEPMEAPGTTSMSAPATSPGELKQRARLSLQQSGISPSVRSETIVLEAAIHLINTGATTVRYTGEVSVKMSRALIWWGCWLQYHMHRLWFDEGSISSPPSDGATSLFHNFQFALIGPGGTGKTTLLLLVEALIEYFAGEGTVHKCAISNTASRLIGGDTLHALCKLPRLDLQSRRGNRNIQTNPYHEGTFLS